MKLSRKTQRLLALALVVVLLSTTLLAIPQPAHAWTLGDVIGTVVGFSLNSLLQGFLSLFTIIQSFLGLLISIVGKLLTFALSIGATANLTAVTVAWTILRDMCNMAFIVLLVIISFATVFNTTGVLKNFYWRTALMPLIVGAIMINFSLAIGQGIVLLSNQVAQTMIHIQPDLGGNLMQAMHPEQFLLDPNLVVSDLTGTLQLKPGQSANAITDGISNATPAEKTRLTQCLNEADPNHNTTLDKLWETIQNVAGQTNTAPPRKNLGECNLEIIAARQGALAVKSGQTPTDEQQTALDALGAASNTAGTTQQMLLLTLSVMLNCVFLFIIISCLLTAGVFLLLRVIVIWVLLAASPIAWLSYAIPGTTRFKTWWKQFIAWNVFGPIYLFLLIPGMAMISRSGDILTALTLNGAGQGVIGGAGNVISLFMFYGFALIVFMGALGLALSSGFAGSIKSTDVVGKWAENLGVFDKAGMAPGRVIGRETGVTPYLKAAKDLAKQSYEDVQAAKRGRFPWLFNTAERAEEKARMKLNVRGADKKYEELEKKRIDEERLRIEKPMEDRLRDLENRAAIETDPIERASLRRQIKDMKKANENRRLALLNSGNRDVALAAAEKLMEDGDLSADNMQKMAHQYASISPSALAGFTKRRDEVLVKRAYKQKLGKDPKREITKYLTMIGNKSRAEDYYEALKKTKYRVYALELGTSLKIERTKKPNGDDYKFNELVAKDIGTFKDDDMVALEDLLFQEGGDPIKGMESISQGVHDAFFGKLLNSKSRANILNGAQNPDQRKRMEDYIAMLTEENPETGKMDDSQLAKDVKGRRGKDMLFETWDNPADPSRTKTTQDAQTPPPGPPKP